MKTLIVATLMGMAAAHYGIDDTAPQSRSNIAQLGSSPQVAEGVEAPAIAGNFEIPAAQIAFDTQGRPFEPLRMPAAKNNGLSVPPGLASDVAQGVSGLDEALSRMPRVAVAMARSIDEHGLAALAYDDPKVKVETDSLAQALGRGLGGIAQAVAKDMTETARKSHL